MTERAWEFGCPKCEGQSMRTVYRGSDEDGFPVRLYQCSDCKHRWGTEERVIAVEEFWKRFHSGNLESRWSYRLQKITCKVCDAVYQGGSYAIHKETPDHRSKLVDPTSAEKSRRNYRRYRRRRAA